MRFTWRLGTSRGPIALRLIFRCDGSSGRGTSSGLVTSLTLVLPVEHELSPVRPFGRGPKQPSGDGSLQGGPYEQVVGVPDLCQTEQSARGSNGRARGGTAAFRKVPTRETARAPLAGWGSNVSCAECVPTSNRLAGYAATYAQVKPAGLPRSSRALRRRERSRSNL